MKEKNFFKKAMWVSKKQSLMLILNPLKNLQKTHAKKVIIKKVTEKWSYLDETAQKTKHVFYKCVLESHFSPRIPFYIYLLPGRLHFVKKGFCIDNYLSLYLSCKIQI